MDSFEDIFSQDSNSELEAATPEVELTEVVETNDVAEEVIDAPEAVETEAEPAPTVEPKMVPLSAVQEERRKAKEAFETVNALRTQLAEIQAKQAQNAVPDPYDDPQGFGAYQQQLVAQQVQQAVALQNFQASQARAVAQHGQDFVNEVAEWAGEIAAADPTFEARVFAQPDPAAWVIEQKKRSDLLKSFEADPDNYVRQRALELGLAAVAPTAVSQPPARIPLGPKSLATAKSRDTLTPNQNAKDEIESFFNK